MKTPPNCDAFNPQNHQVILHPKRKAAVAAAHAPPATSDITALAQIITALRPDISTPTSTTHVSKPNPVAPAAPVPSTPTRRHHNTATSEPARSPARPTPTKLRRFLEHAEAEVGIENATLYQGRLELERYGPDILHEVDNADLRKLAIPPGDIIRLKRAAPKWYNSPAVKRSRSSSPDTEKAAPRKTED